MKRPPWLLGPAGELEAGRRVILDVAEARHARGPLRLTTGNPIVLTDGHGSVAEGVLRFDDRSRAEVVVASVQHQPRPAHGITVAMAMVTGPAMDLTVQKLVEIGVERLMPVATERTQAGLKRARARRDHWHRIGLQSLKQCRRSWAMEIGNPVTLAELVADLPRGRAVVALHDGEPLDEVAALECRLLLVGPEGGFSAAEEQLLRTAGLRRVCLGRYVLRAETAAIVGAARLIARMDAEVHSCNG